MIQTPFLIFQKHKKHFCDILFILLVMHHTFKLCLKVFWWSLKSFDLHENLFLTISETRITKQVSLLNNLNLSNCTFEFTPTEMVAGGTLLYIANRLLFNVVMTYISIKRMNWNLHLWKLSTWKNQILLWESFTDHFHLWIFLNLMAIM